MNAHNFMLARTAPLRLVIFDCDGVLIDSEGIANRVIAEEVTALGWPITQTESEALFLGWTLSDMRPMIERRTGKVLTPQWIAAFSQRLVERLALEATLMPGVPEVLLATTALGLPWRIASNSSRAEMAAKFTRTGIAALTEGRIHSAQDVGRGKPAPDLFLATARAEGVAPAECLVIEDSIPGTQAAVAAGIPVMGYAPASHPHAAERLRAEGATPFGGHGELPGLLALALRRQAA